MRSVLGKHRESTDLIREGFLEYAAGAVAKREFQAQGTTYWREGGSPGYLE